jgi:hypothetical protein
MNESIESERTGGTNVVNFLEYRERQREARPEASLATLERRRRQEEVSCGRASHKRRMLQYLEQTRRPKVSGVPS